MNKLIKKTLSIILTLTMITAFSLLSFHVSASACGRVRVIVRNDTYSTVNGAPWEGVLLDEWVDIDETSSMMSAFIDAINRNGFTQTGAESSYITEVNGIEAGDNDFMSGWMGSINDWFTNQGYSAYTVANGGLESGDEICIMYTSNWGEDLGSTWYNNYTTLNSLEISDGTLTSDFDTSVAGYTLEINQPVLNIKVTPTATNKNFQVRTYKNEYTPAVEDSEYKRSAEIEVRDGDVLYIGVGEPSWPSMGASEKATVYTITVKYKRLSGDVNADGKINILDATEIQKKCVELTELDDDAMKAADFDGDGKVSVIDATEIQRYIVLQ